MKAFSIKEAIKFGWERLKENLWFLIGLQLIVYVIDFAGKSTWVSFLISIFTTFVTANVYLRVKRGEKVDFKNIFAPLSLNKFLHFILAMIIAYAMIFVGFVLLIVPGVIMATTLCFTSYIILDKKIDGLKGDFFFDAIKEGFHMTKGHRMRIFLFLVTVVGLNILGVIALGIGALITMPITGIAMAYVYDTLKNHKKGEDGNNSAAASSETVS